MRGSTGIDAGSRAAGGVGTVGTVGDMIVAVVVVVVVVVGVGVVPGLFSLNSNPIQLGSDIIKSPGILTTGFPRNLTDFVFFKSG